MILSLIVARAQNGVIGKDNKLPWSLPADLKYFKQVTMGKPMIMGRKTWESLGRVLPGRTHIVVSSNPRPADLPAEVLWFNDLRTAIAAADQAAAAKGIQEVMVIGGAQLFEATMPVANRLYLTGISQDVEGDVVLPLDLKGWSVRSFVGGKQDEKNQLPHYFAIYEKGLSGYKVPR